MQGERIDIVPWSPDPAKYVYNALAPAEVSMVIVDEDKNQLLVVVPDDQLSLAIGRQGQNVRLASRLMNWRIDVKSESRYANLEDSGYKSLVALDGVDENMGDKLFSAEITSASILATSDIETIMSVIGVEEEQAVELKDIAALGAASAEQSEMTSDTEEVSGEEQVSEEKLPDDEAQDSGEQQVSEEKLPDDEAQDSGEQLK